MDSKENNHYLHGSHTSLTTDTNTNTNTNTILNENQHLEMDVRGISSVSEYPLTPTFQHTELHSQFISPNIDFDTAAYMLMDDPTTNFNKDIHGPINNPIFKSKLYSANSSPKLTNVSTLSTNFSHNTPPSFDFDAIGQMLMSPKSHLLPHPTFGTSSSSSSSSLLNDLNNDHLKTIENHSTRSPYFMPTIDPITNFPSQYDRSPRLQLPSIKISHQDTMDNLVNNNNPLYTHNISTASSPTSKLFASLYSPLGMSLLPNSSAPSPIIGRSELFSNSASKNLGYETTKFMDLTTSYNNELLSNTETLALESFLDSIANEGILSSKRKNDENKRKRKLETNKFEKNDKINDELNNSTGNNEIEKDLKLISKIDDNNDGIKHDNEKDKDNRNNNNKRKRKKVDSTFVFDSIKEDDNKQQATKQDKKQYHNITEQKRRDMIKSAFDRLHGLIKISKFDLEDKEEAEIRNKKRRKRKTNTSANTRPMKKYDVLKRSIREIEILMEQNESLYLLLDEGDKEKEIV